MEGSSVVGIVKQGTGINSVVEDYLPGHSQEISSVSLFMERVPTPSGPTSTANSDQSAYWLGEFVFATVAKGMESFYDVVHKMMRKWSNEFVVHRLLNFMVLLNPRLNVRQQNRLVSILLKAVDQLIWERYLDPRVMRGIVALACPNQDTGLLFGYLMEVIAGLACTASHPEQLKDPKTTQLDLEHPIRGSVDKYQEDAKIAQTLYSHFCVEQVYVAAMPSNVRRAVLGALGKGTDFSPPQARRGLSASIHQSPPICCITLEPLLCPDGTITSDVVAVIQKVTRLAKHMPFFTGGMHYMIGLDILKSPQIPRHGRW